MNRSNILRFPKLVLLATVAGASLTPISALALPFVLNEDFRGAWNNSLVVGAAWRAKDADKQLVGFNNAPESSGARGAVSGNDDGNLNYQKGDLIAAPITYTTDLELRYQDRYGVYGKARAWYDYAGENKEVPHGSVANGYVPNQKLDDSDYYDYNQFSGYELLDAYAYGNWDIGDNRLTGRFGKQSINWGESLLHLGFNAFNPIDFPALGRLSVRQDDALLPVNRIYGNLISKSGLSLEAFYALDWEASHLPPCGTFGSPGDNLPDPACNYGTSAQPFTDFDQFNGPQLRALMLAPTNEVKKPGKWGQYGLSSRYFVEKLDTEFGLYYVDFNATTPVLSPTKCATSVPTPAGPRCTPMQGLTLDKQYDEDVTGYGLSAVTGFSNMTLSAELSQFRDLPVQRNFPTLMAGVTRGEGIYANRMVPGKVFDGAFKADRTQLLLGSVIDASPHVGLADAAVTIEAAMQWANNLPGTNKERIGRNGNWGEARNPDGSCWIPPVTPASGTPNVECKVDGFATDFSWGYRMLATYSYALPSVGIDLAPALLWNHDVEGYSVDGSQVEGRQIINAQVRGIFQRMFFVQVGRNWNVGSADYDTSVDKEVWSVAAGMAF